MLENRCTRREVNFLRSGLSKINLHKFMHNFKDTINPTCPVNYGIEDAEHFLLLCNSFIEQRQNLLVGFNDVLAAYELRHHYAGCSSVR